MSEQTPKEPFSVDREKVTPFLIRVFVHRGPHSRDSEYRDPTNLPKEGQIHIHTWMDATLSELTALLAKVLPDFRSPRYVAELSFALVYPDRQGRMVVKQSDGKVTHSSSRFDQHEDDRNAMKTLKDLGFQIGDFLDVSVVVKGGRNGSMTRGGLRSRSGTQDNYGPRDEEDAYGPRAGGRGRGGYRGGRRGRGWGGGRRRGRGGYRRR